MITVLKKQLLFYVLFSLAADAAFGQITYTWNRTGTADWNTPANWTPQRNTPAADDILLFSNNAVTAAINIPSQTIGQLVVTGSTVINLEAAAANTVITISGLPGTDLQVAAGAALNITANAANTTLLLAAGATGVVNGSINFSGAPHRLDAEDAGALVFSSPAVFTQGAGCSGSVFNTAGTPNAVVFSAGTAMVQYAGGNPFGLAAPNSKVVFQTGSVLKIRQNVLIATQGRTYADVEIDFAAFNQTLTGSSLPVSINDLTITQGILNLNLTGSSNLSIRGDIFVAAGQALHFNPPTAGMLHLNGMAPQTITNNGTLSFGISQAININNNSGITFNSSVTFNSTVNFTAGIVTVADPYKITFSAAATAAGASGACFVDGKVEKIGNTAFSFPIGKPGFGLVPVGLNNFTGASAATAFTAAYKRQSANSVSTNLAPGIHHISNLDHWTLENSGTDVPAVDVSLYWNAFTSNNGSVNFITLPGFLDLIVARHNPVTAAWDSFGGQGNTTTGSTVVAGGITWPGVTMLPPGVTAAFSLASTTVQNPLPVSVPYTSATALAARSLVECNINCGSNAHVQAALQRADRSLNFNTIETVEVTAATCLQPLQFTDQHPLPGINYYRVKVTGALGKITYSNTTAVLHQSSAGVEDIKYNRVTGHIEGHIVVAVKMPVTILITDMAGRTAVQQYSNAVPGINFVDIDISRLAAGLWLYTVITKNGRVKTLRFIKQ